MIRGVVGRIGQVLKAVPDNGRMPRNGQQATILPDPIGEATERVPTNVQVGQPCVAVTAPNSGDTRNVSCLVQRVSVEGSDDRRAGFTQTKKLTSFLWKRHKH